MTPTKTTIEGELRESRSRAIAKAVVSLHERKGYEPELVFEGAIRGAAALLMSQNCTPGDVAKLLSDAAEEIRTVDLSDLVRIVN